MCHLIIWYEGKTSSRRSTYCPLQLWVQCRGYILSGVPVQSLRNSPLTIYEVAECVAKQGNRALE